MIGAVTFLLIYEQNARILTRQERTLYTKLEQLGLLSHPASSVGDQSTPSHAVDIGDADNGVNPLIQV